MEKTGCRFPLGTANTNAKRAPLKRQNSRLSAPGFCSVDFSYSGNAHPIHHLIQHARGPNNHAPSDLNFEANLRNWHNKGAVKMDEPFKYPAK